MELVVKYRKIFWNNIKGNDNFSCFGYADKNDRMRYRTACKKSRSQRYNI